MTSGDDRGKRPVGDEAGGEVAWQSCRRRLPIIRAWTRSADPASAINHRGATLPSSLRAPAPNAPVRPLFDQQDADTFQEMFTKCRNELGEVSKEYGVVQPEWEDERCQYCGAISALSEELNRLKAVANGVADRVNAQGETVEERLADLHRCIEQVALKGVHHGIELGLSAMTCWTNEDYSVQPVGFPGGAIPENVDGFDALMGSYKEHADAIVAVSNPQSVLNRMFD